jgi:predicted AAA+ superfamily ATPase
MINPRKVYAADTGLITANSLSFSGDKGRRLENIVHNHIRAHFTNICYWSEKNECDFIVSRKGKKPLLIQACYDLNMDNLDREIAGITEAAKFFSVREGTIVTLNQSDKFSKDGVRINVVPAGEFLAENV